MESWNLIVEVLNRINRILKWTLGRYVFDVTLDSSPLSITIVSQNSRILSVTVIIESFRISYNEERTEVIYSLNDPNEEFMRFMEFVKSVRDDLSVIEYDDINKFYIYVIFPLIFPKAIEIGEDYLVEAIMDKCITYYNDNYNKCSPSILNIITTSYSKLHDIYPHYAKRFISTLTIYNNNCDLKTRVTNKKHLESYSNHTEDSMFFKFTNYKFNFNGFQYSLLDLSFLIIFIILYISLYICRNGKSAATSFVIMALLIFFIIIFMGPQSLPLNIRRSSVELFIPFTNFISYPESIQSIELTKPNFFKKLLLIPTSDELNEFIKNHYPYKYSVVSESQVHDIYSGLNGEALVNFKWNCFAKFYHHCNWLIFITFLFIFEFSTIYPTKFLIIDVILGFFMLSFEVRKFIFNPKKYIWVDLNYLNLGAYYFPIISSILYLIKISPPAWMLSISFLLMDAKMISFLLPFEIFGSYLAMMRRVAKHKRVFSFLLILLFIVLTYAHALFMLLRPNNPFDASQPLFNNDLNNPWNMVPAYNNIYPNATISKDPSLIQLPNTNTNLYASYNTSVLAVYQLMTGNTNSLNSWELNQNPVLVIVWVSFYFFVVIFLLNLFIGLLNNAIQETSGREFFLSQKAEIIAEIELFWLLPYQRRWKKWFPDHILYSVYVDDLRKKVQEIRNSDLYKGNKPIIHPKLLNLIGMQEQDHEKEIFLKEKQIFDDEKKIFLKEKQIFDNEKEIYLKEKQNFYDEKEIFLKEKQIYLSKIKQNSTLF